MISKIAVFDLDGTLANSEARFRLGTNGNIDLQHWRDNSTPSMIAKDLPIALQIQKYKAAIACKNTLVIIATARVFCYASYNWCIKHLGTMPDLLSHRFNDNDHRPSNDIKGEYVKNILLKNKGIIKSVTFTDDNKEYLRAFKRSIPKATVIYHPSNQGH